MMDIDDDARVGRKRRRSMSDDEDYAMDDEVSGRDQSEKKKRSMTPAQLKIKSKSKVRSMSQARREGQVPKPHPTRVVPEE